MKVITEIDILKYHMDRIENLLKEQLLFEDKKEMTDYIQEIYASHISVKVILENYFKI